MRVSDISVQVRDKNLVRKGVITDRFLDFEIHPRFNAPSDWVLRLPKTHPMVPHLATAGSGIIVSFYGVEFLSGFTAKPEEVTNTENPDGTYTFRGKDDTALLFHALAFPQPSNADPATQTVAYDTRTGNAETIMRGFVSANLVQGIAPAGRMGGLRSFIRLEATNGNKGTGPWNKSARFDNLGVLLAEVANLAGLGFRLIQRGSVLRFEVYQPSDRSKLVRFDIESGSLKATSLQVSAPNVTRVIAGGRGEGTEREIIQRSTADSTSAEADWGLIIEEFVSYTNAESTAELQQTADERLIKDGFTAVAVKAIPAENSNMRFVTDWNLGDTVGLVAYGQPTTTRVTEAVIIANSERVSVGAAIGDLSGFDPSKALEQRVEDTAQRVSNIERTLELGDTLDWANITGKPTTFPPDSHSHTGTEVTAATTSARGTVELATNAETQTGTDAARAVTPAGLASLTATDTRAGVIEIATAAEVEAATDTTRAVTPGRMTEHPGVPFAMAAGAVGFTASGPSTVGITITLPAGRFSQPPLVAVNLTTGAGGSQKDVPRIYSVSTTSMTGGVWTGDQTSSVSHNTGFSWIAVQMTSGASAG